MDIEGLMLNNPSGDTYLLIKESIVVSVGKEVQVGGADQVSVCSALGSLWATKY